MSLCMNCNSHGADDMEVISNLIKIRLKPKVILNHYMLCVRSAGPLLWPYDCLVWIVPYIWFIDVRLSTYFHVLILVQSKHQP